MSSVSHQARFTEFCIQLGMIVDGTSLATWGANVKSAFALGRITEEERKQLRVLYRLKKPNVRMVS